MCGCAQPALATLTLSVPGTGAAPTEQDEKTGSSSILYVSCSLCFFSCWHLQVHVPGPFVCQNVVLIRFDANVLENAGVPSRRSETWRDCI